VKRTYVIANWKMNLPPEGIEPYLATLSRGAENGSDGARLVVAPPFPYLPDVVRMARGVDIGAQNCGDQLAGAFTGEVSVAMLKERGAAFVLLGHSERRNLYHEADGLIARKLVMAVEQGLVPVLCIGEDLRIRDAGQAAQFLADQIKAVSSPVLENAGEIVIAYEPIWAIGTGRNASGTMVAETAREIRDALRRFWPARYAEAPLLYGGSVTPDNVDDLSRNGQIDGFLVGGASLDSGKLLAIQRGFSDAGSNA
jgi:triosephosphate isomerase